MGQGFEQLSLRSRRRDLQTMGRWLGVYADRVGLSEVDLRTLQLVLDELVSNVIRHGMGSEGDGSIDIRLERVAAPALSVEVSDEGAPFDPSEATPPDLELPLEQRSGGGMGLALVRELTSDLSYRRVDGRNVISFELPLTAP